MITHPEALQKIISTAQVLNIEKVALNHALYRILAEDIVYDVNMPPFNKSAMDGYACARIDLKKELKIIDTIFAGKNKIPRISNGECVKIMTGAPIPQGADMVFMQEDAELINHNTVKCKNIDSKDNICYLAEDIPKGTIVLNRNTLCQPKHIPLLAGAGYHMVKVFQQPHVHVLSTGTELVEPEHQPQDHQIRNSNASQIIAQLNSINIHAVYNGISKDNTPALKATIREITGTTDLLILSGGVSVGAFDLVPSVIQELGFSIVFNKSAIQPGKPIIFAFKNGKYIFGLSGNPVASFIQFELFVKPFLFALQGTNYKPLRIQLPLAKTYKRTKSLRHLFIPAQITADNKVQAIHFNGSANIGAFSHADCLMEIPIGVYEINENDLIHIRPLS